VKNRTFSGMVIGGLLLMLAACGGGSGNSGGGDEPIVLQGVTAWEKEDIQNAGFFMLQEKVKELSDGRLIIEYQGGPEAIPPEEQGEAVRNGVVDVSNLSTAYYASQLPAANTLTYSELSVEEEWDSGAMDYMNRLHNEKLNTQILGRSLLMKLALYTKGPVTSTEDLGQYRYRVSSTYIPLMEALGAEYVEMDPGEIYQALERGVVTGFGWPEYGISELGLHEQVKCKVQPSYWNVTNVNIMNLDAWNDLPPDLQKVVTKASREVEAELPQRTEDYRQEEEQILEESGVENCELSDAQEFTQYANESGWQWVEENLPSGQAQRLKELFSK
jgi:TRAP-type transport system periplasmic protein